PKRKQLRDAVVIGMDIQASADHSNCDRLRSMPATTKAPKKVEGIAIREHSNATMNSSPIGTAIRITVPNLATSTCIKDISEWPLRAVTTRRIRHRPEIETAIQTIATMIGAENTGDETGAAMVATVALANCVKLP